MSFRVLAMLSFVAFALALLPSCGSGGDVLATVGDTEITVDDFRETFDRLSPEEQVRVLDPGGRMALVERIVYRTILEKECAASPPEGAGFWEDLYGTAWLASEWLSGEASGFDSGLDAGDSALFSTAFSLAVVLLDDSAYASRVAEQWNEAGPGEPDSGMALAPWSTDGSSFRVLSGLLAYLPRDLSLIFEGCEGQGAQVRPAYGMWAVGLLREIELDSMPDLDGREGSVLFGRYLSSQVPVAVSSAAVELLAGMVSVDDGTYGLEVPSGTDPGTVLATWPGGELTLGSLSEIMQQVRPPSFFEGIPEELKPFSPPEPALGPGVDMWFYVGRTARTIAQAGLAAEEGLVVPDHVLSAARVEHYLRQVVLQPLRSPGEEELLEFYDEMADSYTMPERRSVLLAYVDGTGEPFPAGVGSFEELGDYRTVLDSSGNMVPTPLQPTEAFGNVLGGAVFEAEPGRFTGPVISPDSSMAAYFVVLEVEGARPIPPQEIWDQLENDYRTVRAPAALEACLMELWALYSVEIDSSRVEGIDPWARTY
jgi:hypothetical protein